MISSLRLTLILFILICHANSVSLFSQSSGYIDGKILNSTTSEPIPFAAIKLKHHQLGVYANAGGDFKIVSDPEFQTDSLIITCIGYKRYSILFKDLSDKKVNKINLKPSIYGLREVKISASRKKLGSITIIGRAIRKIKDNYPEKPFNYISYYRDYQKREGEYINLNEAIVQTLDNGFTSKEASNKYRLLDFKTNTDFPRMNISPYYDSIDLPYLNNRNKSIPDAKLGDQYGNELFILMVHDAIRNFNMRSFSFIEIFAENFIFNHNFAEPVKVLNNNLLLYKIIFNAKSRITGNDLMVSGTIYIQPDNYSIHKLEYSCYYLNKGKAGKQMFNVNIEYGNENSVDSKMYLKYISFNNIFNVVDTTDNTYFKIVDTSWDPTDKSKTSLIFEFSNKVDPQSAGKRENYEIKIGNKTARIAGIVVGNRKVFIRLKNDNFQISRDSCFVNIQNIKDTDGNILNKRKFIELYQYRELFVQEYNKSLPLTDSCYMQYSPLKQNGISKYSGKDKYWMNTPENIKK